MICIITGEIEGQSRKAAEQILVNAGAKIEKSLNKKVQLVVLGKDAGEKKLEKIEQLGVETRDWDDLIEEIKADGGADDAAETEDDEDDAPEEVEEVSQPHNYTRFCCRIRPSARSLVVEDCRLTIV